MVGILAMSASLEDYGSQPCKKSRKDEEAPIKTITNYFSPVSKNPEKVLSSPRSSNIADYFKLNSPINEKEQTPKAKKATNQQDTQVAVADTAGASGKPSKCRKRTNLTKRLCSLKPEAECELDVQKGICKDSENENVCGKTGFMGSDTAALLAAICSNKGDLDDRVVCSTGSSTLGAKDTLNNAASHTDTHIQSKLRKPKQTKAKEAQSNTVQKKQDGESEKPIISRTSLDSTGDLMDSSLEVNVGDSLNGKDSILVVSFEEFIKSQGGKDMESSLEGKDLTPSLSGEDVINENPLRNEEWAQKPSPKTVTVHAQIHVSPPHSYSATTVPKKIASIFLKKKDSEVEKKAVEIVSEQEPVDIMVQNWKSNVAVLEDDLDLAVVEVENLDYAKQKSTVVERQQFMKAFRQPREAGKSVVKKSLPTNKSPADIPAQEGLVERQQRTSSNMVGSEWHQIKEGANDQEETPKSKDAVGVKKKCTSQNAGKNPTLKGKKLQEPSSGTSKASGVNLRRSSRLRTSETPALNSPVKGHSMTDLPLQMSTPKGRIPCRKSDIYRAEVISISTEANSPIRMRFTRLSTRASGKNKSLLADDLFTPRSNKVVASSKKINKAKKLLEKAKAIQQNIAKPETPRRLSSRQATRAPDKVLQNSILIVDESPKKTRKVHEPGRKNRLRSVNDVLGKRVKTVNVSTGQSMSSGKKLKKQPSITVIDDGPDVSENSVDEEQFKAKQEFLKSGLPDSLKRHIAKTTAFMETYALSGSSFQTVVHVQQRDDCHMWHITFPPCPHLTDLDDQMISAVPDVAKLTLSLGEFTCVKDKLATTMAPTMVNKRQVFPDAVRDLLLEEIHFSNPLFPVKRFLSMFLKKQSDSVALLDTYKPGFQSQLIEAALPETGTRGKRKRKDSPVNNSKRKRSAGKAEEQKEICDLTSAEEASSQPNIPAEICGLFQRGQKCLGHKTTSELDINTVSKDTECEDVLWTEKYQPQKTSEMIGNSAAIQQLHSWLKDWKVRAEKEERSQMQKTEKEKSDTWEQSDFMTMDSDSEEESLCNTVLITGPPGVGKTASVYACAQELGFKVFEVNASCQRSGRQILTQLKEATQSHQVDQQGVNAHKPCFFSSFSSTKSPRKLNSPKNVVSSPRKPPASPRGTGLRKGLAPKSLANFFKPSANKRTEEKPSAAAASKGVGKGVFGPREVETKPSKSREATAQKESGLEEKYRKTATSLILFEEVDVIFDDDIGFLSAIKTFMSTTKRPVILTTSDPTFGLMFDGFFENIHFKTPSLVNVATYLQVLCLAENLRTETKDFLTLLSANKCDIRQSLLHLQFWAGSGGGGLVEKPLQLCRQESGPNTEGLKNRALIGSELPKCNIGCTENFMGLNNIISPTDRLLSFIKNHVPQTHKRNVLQHLLTEFQMNNLYFTLSNLEFLLPLPVNVHLPTLPPLPDTSAGLDKNDKAEESPLKVSAQMKKRKKLLLLNDSDLFDSDSVDEMLSLVSGIQSQKETEQKDLPVADGDKSERAQPAPERHRLNQEEQKASLLVYRCLASLADHVDNMSQIDCFTYNPKDQTHFGNTNWTESRIKDGLCDGLRVETRDWSNSQSSGEVRATIEALSFQKCLSKLSTAIDTSLETCTASSHDPTEALTLHVSEERGNVCFSQSAANSSVAEKRLSVVRTVLSSRSFFGLGNRQANVTEYLPAMRCICRLQRLKEQEKTKRRFLHYFEGIHLELSKATLSSLAADFP